MQVNTIIKARWIITSDADRHVLEQHAIVIQDGIIIDILPIAEADGKYQAMDSIDLGNQLLMPGLVNSHTHAAMSLFRGLADDLPLMDWLNNHIWPAEARWVNEEFVADGTRLAIAEMLRSGTTCFNDMYFFPDITAKVAEDAGIRASVGLIAIDFPTVWAQNADEYIDKGLHVHDEYRDSPLITTAFAPHAPYTVSDEPLQRIQTLVNELDIPIHMHVHETADEVNQALEQTGIRPIQRLHNLGLLTPSLLAVHMTQLTDAEIELAAETGVHIIHCPESNMKLASGFCPVSRLQQAGCNTAIGTDSASSNNDLDMLAETRSTALLAKAVAGDASAVPALEAIAMATINGARALGIDAITGSIEIGKSADLISLSMDEPENIPAYNPASLVVYAGNRSQVRNSWVNGRQLLRDRELVTLDESAIYAKTQEWQKKITN